MSENLEFKPLERKAYSYYHQDGLVDTAIGLGILSFGLMMTTGSVVFSWAPAVLILLYAGFKKKITVPRLGYVRFVSERKTIRMTVALVAVGVVAFLFLLGIYVFVAMDSIPPQIDQWLKRYHMLILGVMGALIMVCAGLFIGIKRFYAYAGLALAFISAGIWLGIDPPVYVIALGTVILAVGLWMLVRFLRRYPIEPGEGDFASA